MPRLLTTLSLSALIAVSAHAQHQPVYVPPPPPPPIVNEIHVDDGCRILTQDRPTEGHPYSKPRYRTDPSLCTVQGEHSTQHYEGIVDNGVVKRTKVKVEERTFIFHNITDQPVIFILEHFVPKGWHIDSHPLPEEFNDTVAIFRSHAKPGETVRLHIGERH